MYTKQIILFDNKIIIIENLILLFLVVVAHLRSMLHVNLASCVANNLCTKLVVCA